MSSLRMSYRMSRGFIFGISLCTSLICFADRAGGGFHPNIGSNDWNHEVNGFHNNDARVGNYYPGNGWVAPTYIINNSVQDNYNSDCQQCDSNGNCIQNQDCN